MFLERKYHILNMERQVHILDQWETTHIKFMRYKINLNISFFLEPWGERFRYESASVCTSVWSVDQTATVLMLHCLKYRQFLVKFSYRLTPNFSTKPPTSGLRNSDKLSILFTYLLYELSKVTCFYLDKLFSLSLVLWRLIFSLHF